MDAGRGGGIPGIAETAICPCAEREGGPSEPSLRLARGQRLAAGCAASGRVQFVHAGLIATCIGSPDGRRQIVVLSFPGEVVCPMAASGAETWCEALAESELCTIDLAGGPGGPSGTAGWSSAAEEAFRLAHARLAEAALQLFALGRIEGWERLCHFLAQSARRYGRRQGCGAYLALPMSREDIADHLGLNPDTVSRLMTRARRAGLVRTSAGLLRIPDLERLEAEVPIACA